MSRFRNVHVLIKERKTTQKCIGKKKTEMEQSPEKTSNENFLFQKKKSSNIYKRRMANVVRKKVSSNLQKSHAYPISQFSINCCNCNERIEANREWFNFVAQKWSACCQFDVRPTRAKQIGATERSLDERKQRTATSGKLKADVNRSVESVSTTSNVLRPGSSFKLLLRSSLLLRLVVLWLLRWCWLWLWLGVALVVSAAALVPMFVFRWFASLWWTKL